MRIKCCLAPEKQKGMVRMEKVRLKELIMLVAKVEGSAGFYSINIDSEEKLVEKDGTVILADGTKLRAIISQMAIDIQERRAVVQGIPLVQVSDSHFWFSWPQLILFLIHFDLFQYEFGLRSCFNEEFELILLRICLGVGAQFVCSYVTLPLNALVTQMGSTMKRSIFDDQTSKDLMNWQKQAAKKKDVR